ncbi:Prevent-host-death family protein [Candidatus Promineifilum breve]|uniref:Antitoxin n=1 Tax=Candidatus Promineifilum breve TaxID=1806508 RepID=A0A160T280_9CHLR|nr:type II toxin-antitoxin system prevent-host-death family antitoxin [Candidatus Promineifilum breve]CUS02978.2 Prevent-host-death family protein [Candidatus Promineifilum breve]
MTIELTYSQARANLAQLLNEVTENRDIVIIRRRHGEDAALIAASELTSLLETAYLLRSPANAERLLTALNDALQGEGRPMNLMELRAEVGLDGEAA